MDKFEIYKEAVNLYKQLQESTFDLNAIEDPMDLLIAIVEIQTKTKEDKEAFRLKQEMLNN